MYVYVLLEFQSTGDHFMALRVLNYLTNFYMDYVQSHRRVRTLPPVFPIVLYNGDARWTAPERVEALIEQPSLLGRFGVQFAYFKIAENEFSPACGRQAGELAQDPEHRLDVISGGDAL